jgi:hypothetical protein
VFGSVLARRAGAPRLRFKALLCCTVHGVRSVVSTAGLAWQTHAHGSPTVRAPSAA